MNDDIRQNQYSAEGENTQNIGNMSLIEMGEKLFQWRYYTSVPALMMLLLFSNATARTATVGTILIIIGTIARIYSVAFMGDDAKDAVGMDHLVSTGPFAIVRNPLYISNLIITMGVIFYCSTYVLGFPLMLFFIFQYHCIAKYEESTLLAKFGDEYQRYKDRVPAWIPLRMPLTDDFPVPPSISSAFVAEKKSLVVIGALLFLLMLASR